jgi:hypothetical protein
MHLNTLYLTYKIGDKETIMELLSVAFFKRFFKQKGEEIDKFLIETLSIDFINIKNCYSEAKKLLKKVKLT